MRVYENRAVGLNGEFSEFGPSMHSSLTRDGLTLD